MTNNGLIVTLGKHQYSIKKLQVVQLEPCLVLHTRVQLEVGYI